MLLGKHTDMSVQQIMLFRCGKQHRFQHLYNIALWKTQKRKEETLLVTNIDLRHHSELTRSENQLLLHIH